MFKEKEDATHIRAAEVMRELGWDATSQGTLLQSMLQMEWTATYWDGMPCSGTWRPPRRASIGWMACTALT